MKLFIVVYLATNLAATIGPVPYDMEECQARVEEEMSIINADQKKKDVADAEKLVMRCEYHEERPKFMEVK